MEVDPRGSGKPFDPTDALGVGVDGQDKGDIARIYTPEHLRQMLSAGLKPLTYRLRTELGVEDWHWNLAGSWSDTARQQGYWSSSPVPARPIRISNGYDLPRRGDTIDQANNHGYSRLDDGDSASFWKSNPYLDRYLTHEENSRHPQWIVIDLGTRKLFNGIRILWGQPYATQYRVEWWQGDDETGDNDQGSWRTSPEAQVHRGEGGNVLLRLSPRPIIARFVRVWMTESSDRAPAGSSDVRDGLGYAARELYLGTLDSHGHFGDMLRHGKSRDTQTRVSVSSNDPWHRAVDRDPNVEQPGFDLVERSGLTNGLPMLAPVPILYSTPENAVAEIRYLRARGYPVRGVELGEEPDGQFITAEDFGALYVQWVDALRRFDPHLPIGGPSFQDADVDVLDWPERPRPGTWLGRFVTYLRQHGHGGDVSFVSFEWYPVEDVCAPPTPLLEENPARLASTVRRLRESGLPPRTALMISEYGYSPYAARAEVDLPGMILNADVVGQFLSSGGATAYLYGYEPNSLIQEKHCPNPENSWGNLALLLEDDERDALYRTPAYYGAWLLTHEWCNESGVHRLYPVALNGAETSLEKVIGAYAVQRPGGAWSILLLNRDSSAAHRVRIRFRGPSGAVLFSLPGTVQRFQYGPAQYAWHPDGEHGHPSRDLPPATKTLPGSDAIELLPLSLTVVRQRAYKR